MVELDGSRYVIEEAVEEAATLAFRESGRFPARGRIARGSFSALARSLGKDAYEELSRNVVGDVEVIVRRRRIVGGERGTVRLSGSFGDLTLSVDDSLDEAAILLFDDGAEAARVKLGA